MQVIIDMVSGWFSFKKIRLLPLLIIFLQPYLLKAQTAIQSRERISINDGCRFMRYESELCKLMYDERPAVAEKHDNIIADAKPT
jgi:beta-galactosidase